MYPRQEVETEYNDAAGSELEFEKVKWNSQASMMNRFRLAMSEMPFHAAGTWLDVGCGTGAFQALVRATYPRLRAKAIDISVKLLQYAQARPDTRGTEFELLDFMDLGQGAFDLITCIGVLQKTTFTVAGFFQKAFSLLPPGGSLFLDTKHRGWRRFTQLGCKPEPDHEWFTVKELCAGGKSAGLRIRKIGGFLPAEGLVVSPEESHTVFLIAER